MKLKNSNKNLIIWCLIVFLSGLFVRIYTIHLKQDIHEDEALTVLLSNYSETGWSKLPETNKVFTGKDLKEMTYWNDKSYKDTLSDIKNLYIYTRDDSHTNLYYTIIRLTFKGVNEFDIKSTIIRGGILNLFIYILSFFFMFKLLSILFKDRPNLIPVGLFTAFLNTASISNTCYLRPYALQEAAFILLTYYFVKLLIKEKTNIYKVSLSVCFALLTGYYAIFYVSILALTLFIKNTDRKFLLKAGGLSILFTEICYPAYFIGITSYRAVESIERFLNFSKNLYYSALNFPLIYLKYLFSMSLLIFLIYLSVKIIKNKLNTDGNFRIIPLIFWLNFLWTAIIIFIAPYKILRYIMPVFPILSLIIPYTISYFKKSAIYIGITIAIFCLNYYFAVKFFENSNIGKYVPVVSRIDFLTNRQTNKFLFEENVNKPVIILKDQENPTIGEILKISEILPYFDDKQNYIFVNPNAKITYPEFYMLIPKTADKNFLNLAQPYFEKYKNLNIQNCAKFYTCIEFKQ